MLAWVANTLMLLNLDLTSLITLSKELYIWLDGNDSRTEPNSVLDINVILESPFPFWRRLFPLGTKVKQESGKSVQPSCYHALPVTTRGWPAAFGPRGD